jgi:predicted CoA-binding protein
MQAIGDLLRASRVIAVVGLSSKKFRASYGVAEYMQREGYRVIPVNPHETKVLGEPAYARLEDVPEHIDIVDIFRRSEFVAPLVESAIKVGASAIWMQEGVEDEEAARKATKAGLAVVMDRCILKEHQRYLR